MKDGFVRNLSIISKLYDTLYNCGIDESLYSIGELEDDKYCLFKGELGWYSAYCMNGKMHNLSIYRDLDSACVSFIKTLSKGTHQKKAQERFIFNHFRENIVSLKKPKKQFAMHLASIK